MRIIGHGIDIETIMGIKQQIDSPSKKWIESFCSHDERMHASQAPAHYRYFAGRFAAKEAVVKALGTGFAGDISWHGIEILNHESGAPFVRLREDVKAFADKNGITEWFISLSYTEEMAIASAIAVGE
jgi:holo-[acyl-carrier protein] synthase